MTVKLLTGHHLEFLSLKGGGTGSSESTLVKISYCCKSHAMAQIFVLLDRIFFLLLLGESTTTQTMVPSYSDTSVTATATDYHTAILIVPQQKQHLKPQLPLPLPLLILLLHSTIRQIQHIGSTTGSISYSFATSEPQVFSSTEKTSDSDFQVSNDAILFMLFLLSLLIIPVLGFVAIGLKRRKQRKMGMRTIEMRMQHAGFYINTTTQTGHLDTLLLSSHNDLMNSIKDTNLSSSEADFD